MTVVSREVKYPPFSEKPHVVGGVKMQVQVKLYAMLQQYAPAGERAGTPFAVDLPTSATLADLIGTLRIPALEVKVVYVNGRTRPESYELQVGDAVGIFSPVGGG